MFETHPRYSPVPNRRRRSGRWVAGLVAAGLASSLVAGAAYAQSPYFLFEETIGSDDPELIRQDLEGSDPYTIVPVGYESPYFVTSDTDTVVFTYDGTVESSPTYGTDTDNHWVSLSGGDAGLNRRFALGPDDTRVVFWELVETTRIYIRAIDGASDALLLSSEDEEAGPATLSNAGVFTPDGTRVVFLETVVDEDRLYSRFADGSGQPVLLSNFGGPFGDVSALYGDLAFSPDSSRVAYLIEEGALSRIYSAALDGSGEPRLISSEAPAQGAYVGDFFYGPDSEYVVFEEFTGEYTQIFSKRDLSAWPLRTPLSNPAGDASFAEGNPIPKSTSWVVFMNTVQGSTGIYRAALDASSQDDAVLLSTNPGIFSRNPAISPDGQTVIYQTNASPYGQLYAVATDGEGGDPVLLSSPDLMAEPNVIRTYLDTPLNMHGAATAFSPDHSTVVFQTLDFQNQLARLYSRPLDGSGIPALISNPDGQSFTNISELGRDLQWSLDGLHVAFTESTDPGSADRQAWINRADGSEDPVRLSSGDPQAEVSGLLFVVAEPGPPLLVLAALASLAGLRRGRSVRA